MHPIPAIVLISLLAPLPLRAEGQRIYPVERLDPPARTSPRNAPRDTDAKNQRGLCAPVPLQPISPTPHPEHSAFGQAIDLQASRLIVGDPFHDEPLGQDDVGAAYFFEKIGDHWTPQGIVTVPRVGIDGNFGWAVAISGDFALASSPFHILRRGEVFVFKRHDGPAGVEWREHANIKPDPAVSPIYSFGYDVDLHNDIAAIGALYSNDEPNGWVELHANIEGSWRLIAHLRPPDGTMFDDFGRSVSVFGSRVLVGAPFHPDPTNEGAAYLFQKTETGWTLEANLTPPGLEPADRAGWQVALGRDTAVVASPFTGRDAPKVWIYRFESDHWRLEHEITTPRDNSYIESDFARSIDLANDTLIVGAPYAEIWGAAYIYRRIDGYWAFLGRVRFDDVSDPAHFVGDLGRAVAADEDTAVASAPYTTVLESSTIVTGLIQPIDLSAPAFAVTRQPDNRRADPGDTATFEAAAVGPGTLHYQWFKGASPLLDNERISGATTPTLTIGPLVIEDSALYTLHVTSTECGTVISRPALLDMGNCIEIVNSPEPQTLQAGAPLVLHCDVNGILPLTFRWKRAGSDLDDDGRILGSATPTLTINPTLPEDRGNYRLHITSQCGQTATNNVAVAFLSCSDITREPDDLYTYLGNTIRLAADASSHLPLTYQWWRNGMPLADGGRFSGAESPALTIAESIAPDAARYKCVISCAFNEHATREAVVTLNPPGCLGDANNDRRVNMVDLSTILELWNNNYRPTTGPGDTDRDGLVGFSDLTMTLARYGTTCP
ncbi:MAG: hypothetical protein JNK58_01430 [Phycisphaerae bacterium]|nr:hypothetical protein [Phycisphaerae bacterium]